MHSDSWIIKGRQQEATMIELFFIVPLLALVIFYGGYYLFGFFYGRRIRYRSDNSYLPKVSLVIATYNEEETIEQKIQNTIDLDYPKDRMELIFVDSSTDGTMETIETFKNRSSSKVLIIEESTRRGLASALNMGYSAATGEIVIKTDCDIPLEKGSIREIVKYFSPDVGAVSGAVVISNKSNVEKGYRSIFEKLRAAEANLDSTYLYNPFCAFRKNLIEPVDPKSVADDAELALRIRKKGYRTVYSPSAIAYETSPTSIKDRINQKSRRAEGHIRLILQNLDVFLNPKLGKFGLIIFPANFFMMMLSPWLIVVTLAFGAFSLGVTFGYLCALFFTAALVIISSLIYVKSMPKMVAGFIDAQVNLMIGFWKLVTQGPSYMWTKEKRVTEKDPARARAVESNR
jgi:cellulose synthase/poly-beta-1,6-N-acetylglucosamine synthase-like glycosyltransferase